MIVVDTNVLAYLLLPSEHTARAEALLRRRSEWSAPLLWRSELRNVLTTLVRRGDLDVAAAKQLQAEAEELLSGSEYSVPSPRVLELAGESGCSAYDCEFVALAEFLDAPLYTLDAQLLKAFPQHALPLPAR